MFNVREHFMIVCLLTSWKLNFCPNIDLKSSKQFTFEMAIGVTYNRYHKFHRFIVTYRWVFTRRHENCRENYGAGRDQRCRGQVMSRKSRDLRLYNDRNSFP